ncbi:hypothetical protein F4861DRAFT_523254 [Xylaria intraflava]|nr:hypothetical protein F4861DRAFT_523254 [Xylaria intraflava]
MGGQAFASGPDAVATPRMKPEVYMAMRDRCQDKLRGLFEVVATPIEGPAKTSFGDIDIFVALEQKHVFTSADAAPPSPKQAIYDVLGAIRSKSDNEHAITTAIPWPEDFAFETGGSEGKGKVGASTLRGIQVDIHICETVNQLQWMLFKHAHGDFWNILGSTIRPLGLTIDEVGLYVRIPEIEEINKKQAKVLLSTDPGEVLRFLNLDAELWEAPFASDEALFEYATTCRFFWISSHKPTVTANAPDETEGAKNLKSNERRRLESRPLFRKWVQEFLPACRESGRFPRTSRPTRDAMRRTVFAEFPGTEAAYYARRKEWRVKRQRERLWNDVIKPAIPADVEALRRGCCAAALKKIILGGDDSSFGIAAPATLWGADDLFDEDAVRAWVESHWEAVADTAWRDNMERFAASKARKAAADSPGIPGTTSEETRGD